MGALSWCEPAVGAIAVARCEICTVEPHIEKYSVLQVATDHIHQETIGLRLNMPPHHFAKAVIRCQAMAAMAAARAARSSAVAVAATVSWAAVMAAAVAAAVAVAMAAMAAAMAAACCSGGGGSDGVVGGGDGGDRRRRRRGGGGHGGRSGGSGGGGPTAVAAADARRRRRWRWPDGGGGGRRRRRRWRQAAAAAVGSAHAPPLLSAGDGDDGAREMMVGLARRHRRAAERRRRAPIRRRPPSTCLIGRLGTDAGAASAVAGGAYHSERTDRRQPGDDGRVDRPITAQRQGMASRRQSCERTTTHGGRKHERERKVTGPIAPGHVTGGARGTATRKRASGGGASAAGTLSRAQSAGHTSTQVGAGDVMSSGAAYPSAMKMKNDRIVVEVGGWVGGEI